MPTQEAVNIESIVPLLNCIEYLHVCASFVVENLNVEILLETSFINKGVRRIFPTECKTVSWYSKPGRIFPTKPVLVWETPMIKYSTGIQTRKMTFQAMILFFVELHVK